MLGIGTRKRVNERVCQKRRVGRVKQKNTPGRKDEERRNRKGYARKRATREEEEGVC